MPTMNDVAKLAGVSRGTVSNYINGVKIKEESQVKIQNAINQLNYIPNTNARQLKTSRSDIVVFILPTTRTPFFGELTYEMQQALQRAEYKMILCNSNNDIQQEIEYIHMGQMQKVAGIITMSYSDLSQQHLENLPIVSIENKISKRIPCVSSDNYQGGVLAAEKLISSGAKNLLLITRTTTHTEASYGQRSRGFIDCCRKHGLKCEVFWGEHHEETFYPALATYLKESGEVETVDGIFAVADQYADFAMELLTKAGRRVPKDLQIIGFDGSKMYPEQEEFISTIRQPVALMAETCVSILEELLNKEGPAPAEEIVLPVKFIPGGTSI